jgi:hypothetical protein
LAEGHGVLFARFAFMTNCLNSHYCCCSCYALLACVEYSKR